MDPAVCGLQNVGNTCFVRAAPRPPSGPRVGYRVELVTYASPTRAMQANSAMQCLIHSPPFRDSLTGYDAALRCACGRPRCAHARLLEASASLRARAAADAPWRQR